MAQKALVIQSGQKSAVLNRVEKLEEEGGGGVTPEEVLAILSALENSPIKVAGLVVLVDAGGGNIVELAPALTAAPFTEGKTSVLVGTSQLGLNLVSEGGEISQATGAEAPVVGTIPAYNSGGALPAGDAAAGSAGLYHAANMKTLNSRLSAAQRTAINALPASGATVDQVVAALKAS